MMSSDRWLESCGDKLLERLLPQGKFGNMERSDTRLYGRSLSIC
jgi:hypothetical protein